MTDARGRHKKGNATSASRIKLPKSLALNDKTQEVLTVWQRMNNAEREAYGWQFEKFKVESELCKN